jgi:hypothetical protein
MPEEAREIVRNLLDHRYRINDPMTAFDQFHAVASLGTEELGAIAGELEVSEGVVRGVAVACQLACQAFQTVIDRNWEVCAERFAELLREYSSATRDPRYAGVHHILHVIRDWEHHIHRPHES